MDNYPLGTAVTLRATFTVDGARTSPDSLQLTVRDPLGVVTTYVYGVDAVISKIRAGDFQAIFTPDSAGEWDFHWLSTDVAPGAVDGAFLILAPFAPVVTAEDVEAIMSTGLTSSVLQEMIDREEDWLANDPRVGIGQLTGSRDQIVYRPGGSWRPIFLPRTTTAVVVTDNAVVVQVILLDGARVEPVSGSWRGPQIVLTYTPSDLPRVRRVILELVRLAISATPYGQEATQGHSYSRPSSTEAMRSDLARSLRAHRGPIGVSMVSSGPLITSRLG